MKEHPILFSGPMVRAILDGKKTQTRRVVKHIPALGWAEAWCHRITDHAFIDIVGDYKKYCPYGQPCNHIHGGGRLWVRENFYVQPDLWARNHEPQPIHYAADGGTGLEDYVKKPCSHMPRWASRLTLEITNVRVERLQDISFNDAIAEGAFQWAGYEDEHGMRSEGINFYRKLWESINGPGSWQANPWVWVIEFKEAK